MAYAGLGLEGGRSPSPPRGNRVDPTSRDASGGNREGSLILSQETSPLSPSHLFSSFTSLAVTLGSHDDEYEYAQPSYILDYLRSKDIGIINIHLTKIGSGSSFYVSAIREGSKFFGSDSIVIKHTIPVSKLETKEGDKARISALMFELQVLAHKPIRRHENVVNLLGLAWETDIFELQRRWPVLLMEKADKGSLSDFLGPSETYSYQIKKDLCLDIALGLQVLHQCGVIHGDIKPDNILVFTNHDPQSKSKRPFIVKLADFGGSLFGAGINGRLCTGTWPWNAPEWKDHGFDTDTLLQTDVYSAGLLFWFVMADGRDPFAHPAFDSVPPGCREDRVGELKKTDGPFLAKLKSISGFQADVDIPALESILDCTVRVDPRSRNLDRLRKILEQGAYQPRADPDYGGLPKHQYQLRHQFLPFSSHGIASLETAISRHLTAELTFSAHDVLNNPEQASEAAYGLAVMCINEVTVGRSRDGNWDEGLRWLNMAAFLGNDRAQAVIYRAYKALGRNVLPDIMGCIPHYLASSASKGSFIAAEDLAELNLQEQLQKAKRILRLKYGGTGRLTFDRDWPLDEFDLQVFATDITIQRSPGLWVGTPQNRRGDQGYHIAASYGLQDSVKRLIEVDPLGINATNINGETPLLLACRSGHFDLSMLLLDAGADPKIASHNGDTPMHWLLAFDDDCALRVGSALFAKGADLNCCAQKASYIYCGENAFIEGTPLMRAISRNRLPIVEVLLQLGADPNATVNSASALDIAASLHYPHILKLLLSKSSSEPRTVSNASGRSLLVAAIAGGCQEAPGSMFGRLRRHGSRWRSRAQETLETLFQFGARDHLHDLPGAHNLTALFHATRSAELDIVEYLLQNGCGEDINTLSPVPTSPEEVCTPLVMSIWSKKKNIFHTLMKNGADVTIPYVFRGDTQLTPLYECASYGNDDPEFAQALIDAGVGVDESLDQYETPFGCAVRNRCFQLAECLLHNKANINFEYSRGLFFESSPKTVLGHVIVENTVGSLACLNFLLRDHDQPPSFFVQSESQHSVFHELARVPEAKQDDLASHGALRRLLDFFRPTKAQLELPFSFRKNTALHIAALTSNLEVAQGLLDAGADPAALNDDGSSPLVLARQKLYFFDELFEPQHSAKSVRKQREEGKRRREKLVHLFEEYSPNLED
ncbi:hypothetical protein FGG08_006202 [Glutinoglossum americanum]|uniref:Protein kinase domain-containing protein n=1 Tax=Glutinoglossum americanum TaxID=1670608 RepID=A0A9P8KXQ9_9PEZI|nr:hypothetical protein FGG08_006202 [Glutinoglossum americanum]